MMTWGEGCGLVDNRVWSLDGQFLARYAIFRYSISGVSGFLFNENVRPFVCGVFVSVFFADCVVGGLAQ